MKRLFVFKFPALLAFVLSFFLTLPEAMAADTIELKSSERLEGKFKQATSAGVVIEIGGQPVSFALDKVAAIYFAGVSIPKPATSHTSSLFADALKALKTLDSVVSVGPKFLQYNEHLITAKSQIDPYLNQSNANPDPARAAIKQAIDYHLLAARAWNSSLTRGDSKTIGTDPLWLKCEPFQEFLRTPSQDTLMETMRKLSLKDPIALGVVACFSGPPFLMKCGSQATAEAEKLMKESKVTTNP